MAFMMATYSGCKENSDEALSPKESLKHFVVEDGFEVKLVASEPFVQAPIALDFDADGRLWVMEMTGYMQDTLATGQETQPSGKIVILEDENGDGEMDSRKVFMDSLILPRAMAFYNNGLLVAEPPNLWFVEINGDTAGRKYIVDSTYASGGTTEHQANGLMRGIDNWLYNAKSDKRYRMIDGKWVIEHTQFRGQWGITQDDDGRLFYNTNSANLLGDYFLPGVFVWNKDQTHVDGFDEVIVSDNRTFPIHATPGVNRGYQKGVLDSLDRLVDFTAACGPVIYRGGLFGKEYYQNAFVAEPAGNLIKRDILNYGETKITGKEAYLDKEFLASDDERFRPVNLYNGLDGALYIVDMYRGIIQDATYITPYLKKHIADFALTKPINRGRIYKVIPKGTKSKIPVLKGLGVKELIDSLGSPQSKIRELAQRLIVDRKMYDAEPVLRDLLQNKSVGLQRIHAFWTLEGLGKLTDEDLKVFLGSGDVQLVQQAIACITSQMDESNKDRWINSIDAFSDLSTLTSYIAFYLSKSVQNHSEIAFDKLKQLSLKESNNPFVADAVLSGLNGKEESFSKWVISEVKDTTQALYVQTKNLIDRIHNLKTASADADKKYASGKRLFVQYCVACHGADGEGIQGLGAPLNQSQWVNGDRDRMIAIVLYGLTGPIKVGDKLYQPPEVSGDMPAFGHNDALGNSDVTSLLNYVRHAWNNKGSEVAPDDVNRVRRKFAGRTSSFTMKELDETYK